MNCYRVRRTNDFKEWEVYDTRFLMGVYWYATRQQARFAARSLNHPVSKEETR